MSNKQKNNQKGVTIVELMIAMIIFLIVTGSIYGVMQIAQRSRSTVNQQVPLTKNVRFSLNTIGRDTLNAGFDYPLKNSVKLPDNRITTLLGLPNDADADDDTIPPIIAGNNIQPNTFNQTPNTFTDRVTFIFKDSTFNLVGDPDKEVSQSLNISAAATVAGIDQIVPISGSAAVCSVNDIYVITGNTGSTLGVATEISGNTIKFADAVDPLKFNKSGPAGVLRQITTPASIQRMQIITYFVDTDGILNRREYANAPGAAAFVDNPLIYGVENFQIQYVLDDGTLTDSPVDSSTVRQVRFTISVRSTELNAAGQPNRVTMTSTFSTRNLGYDAS